MKPEQNAFLERLARDPSTYPALDELLETCQLYLPGKDKMRDLSFLHDVFTGLALASLRGHIADNSEHFWASVALHANTKAAEVRANTADPYPHYYFQESESVLANYKVGYESGPVAVWWETRWLSLPLKEIDLVVNPNISRVSEGPDGFST